jgi:hypothetical protein
MSRIYTFNYIKGDKTEPSEVLFAENQEEADRMFRELFGWECVSDEILSEENKDQLDLF